MEDFYFMNKKKSSMRMINLVVDFIHIGVCIGIIVLAVLLFFNPVKNAFCYPIAFLLASVLNFSSAYAKMNKYRPIKQRSISGIAALVGGIFFLIIAIISALTVW